MPSPPFQLPALKFSAFQESGLNTYVSGVTLKGKTQSPGLILATRPLATAILTPKLLPYANVSPVGHQLPPPQCPTATTAGRDGRGGANGHLSWGGPESAPHFLTFKAPLLGADLGRAAAGGQGAGGCEPATSPCPSRAGPTGDTVSPNKFLSEKLSGPGK